MLTNEVVAPPADSELEDAHGGRRVGVGAAGLDQGRGHPDAPQVLGGLVRGLRVGRNLKRAQFNDVFAGGRLAESGRGEQQRCEQVGNEGRAKHGIFRQVGEGGIERRGRGVWSEPD